VAGSWSEPFVSYAAASGKPENKKFCQSQGTPNQLGSGPGASLRLEMMDLVDLDLDSLML